MLLLSFLVFVEYSAYKACALTLFWENLHKKKENQSHYRPAVAQRVP